MNNECPIFENQDGRKCAYVKLFNQLFVFIGIYVVNLYFFFRFLSELVQYQFLNLTVEAPIDIKVNNGDIFI